MLVTAENEDDLARLGRVVVDERLAACITVVPRVRSIYRWQGDVHDETEALGLIKTTREALDRLRDRWKDIHSYDVPEFLVLPVSDGLQEYCAWLVESTSGSA